MKEDFILVSKAFGKAMLISMTVALILLSIARLTNTYEKFALIIGWITGVTYGFVFFTYKKTE